ncbi:MAG: HlyD family efflux transporter periplasmic adaptor subunit [Deltaproteobacteria bacterium]|nr:HlyD family efflux transporter periplasmic adaptor subunit [Deltaproteobacteria bacterium]
MSFDPFQGRPRLRRTLPWIAWAAAVAFIVFHRDALSIGTVSPGVAEAQVATIIAPRSGRVVSVLRQTGDAVVVGDVVVVIEAADLLAELAVARADLVALESGVLAKSVDVREADREVVARLGQDLERAAVDAARFRADLDADKGELEGILELLKRQEGLVQKGLATTTELEQLSLKKSGLEQRVRTSLALVEAARAHEDQSRTRLQAFLTERKRPPATTTKPVPPTEVRVAPAEAEALAQAARVRALEDAVAALSIKAPIAGSLAAVSVVVGSSIAADQPVASIVSTSAPIVSIYADERMARRVAVGDRVVLRPSDHASDERLGRVRALAPLIAELPPRFRLIPTQPGFARVVVVELTDDQPPPFPGMAFDAHFLGAAR